MIIEIMVTVCEPPPQEPFCCVPSYNIATAGSCSRQEHFVFFHLQRYYR